VKSTEVTYNSFTDPSQSNLSKQGLRPFHLALIDRTDESREGPGGIRTQAVSFTIEKDTKIMIRLRSHFTAGFIAIALTSFAGIAGAATADAVKAPPVPSDIEVPAGNTAFLEGNATGTQNYVCLPSTSGFAWTFFSPQATLFQTIKWLPRDFQQQIITHFLSPNPFESGKPRVTWQSSFDTSEIWGKINAATTDPNFVKPGAVAWLLVQSVGNQRGPTGGALLAQTTFVQRLNTSGGVAPSTGCSQASDVGGTALVPYTADYFFYKASPKY
jgi:Protein of unknown function (DUF3455)